MIDEKFDDGQMSGTFRWSKAKKFLKLPVFPKNRVDYLSGWGPYLKSRSCDLSLVDIAKSDSSLLDCLSFPLTIAFWLNKFNFFQEENREATDSQSTLNIVVFGASRKAVMAL
jgi:hypothetical protein